MLASRLGVGAVVLVAIGLVSGLVRELRARGQLQTELARQMAAADTRFAELKRQFRDRTQQANTLAAEVSQKIAQAKSPASAPTQDQLTALLATIDGWVAAGRFQEALAEYVRLYHEPYGLGGRQRLIRRLQILGTPPHSHGPALAALRELRDAVQQDFATKPGDADLLREIIAFNSALDEGGLTVALYDSLPADDPLRKNFGPALLPALMQARRYADALKERPFASMLALLGANPSATSDAELFRTSVINDTAAGIEILTGLGRSDEARMLTEKLLQYDQTGAARELIRQHVERANQPRN